MTKCLTGVEQLAVRVCVHLTGKFASEEAWRSQTPAHSKRIKAVYIITYYILYRVMQSCIGIESYRNPPSYHRPSTAGSLASLLEHVSKLK